MIIQDPMYCQISLSASVLLAELYEWIDPPPEYRRATVRVTDHKLQAELVRRLRSLKLATRFLSGNRVCAQLKGREPEIVTFWYLRRYSEEQCGRAPSDRELALLSEYLLDQPCSLEQARRRRKIIDRLEAMPDVWGPLKWRAVVRLH